MAKPVSEPSTPMQAQSDSYPVAELALFRAFTRETYRAAFGVEPPAFDPTRPVKAWFDTTADTSNGANLAVYRVVDRDSRGSPVFRQMVIPAAEAETVNLPDAGEIPPGPERGMPIRALLPNEALRDRLDGVSVIRTDVKQDEQNPGDGFTAEDRGVLRSIHRILLDPASIAPSVSLFPKSAPPPPPPVPKMPYANSADAYWATQPPEVQALRRIPELGQRQALAYQLAAQGFAIDPRIMVHLWDPLSSMRSWQAAGYTWVPAVGQPGVEVSPGLTFPGRKPYDPNNPPPGSIIVTTAFADGYEY